LADDIGTYTSANNIGSSYWHL